MNPFIFSSREQDLIISVVKRLGHFVISDNVTETTTHLICGGPRRTLNVLYGIMRGIMIVHKQWVRHSYISPCLENGSNDSQFIVHFEVLLKKIKVIESI